MLTGSCLCGAVTLSVAGELEHEPEACHCSQCRKQTGSLLMGINIRKTALTIRGQEAIAWYASSNEVDRGFCSICGSTLFWQPNMPDYEWTGVALGLFDQPVNKTIAKHTFFSDRGSYYNINDDVPKSNSY